MGKAKICVASLGAHPLLARQNMELVGRAESQSVLLRKELAQRDFDVLFVVLDCGRKSPVITDTVKLLTFQLFLRLFYIIRR